jgi:hypothetical protein
MLLTRPYLYRQTERNWKVEKKLDLTDTIKDGARLFLVDEGIRRQLLLALTEDSKLHIEEVRPYMIFSSLKIPGSLQSFN